MKNEKLELLKMAKGFTVNEVEDGYEVESNNAELTAVISENKCIEYYRTGAGTGYSDYLYIDIDELLKLKAFCEALMK